MGNFFTNERDLELAKSLIAQSSDFYIKEQKAEGTGVIDSSTPATTTLTDSTQSFVADELLGLKLVINMQEYIIAGNDATKITFDSSSNAISNGSYTYRVMGLEQFMGYCEKGEIDLSEETMQFKTGIPRRLVDEALLERTMKINAEGKAHSFGLWKSIFNLEEDDSDATKYVGWGGSNPPPREFYEVILKNKDRAGRKRTLNFFHVQLKPNGNVSVSSEDFKSLPFSMTVFSDPLRITGNSTEMRDMFKLEIIKNA